MTTFQKKVYDALCEIPEGKVVSYQTLAEHLGIRSLDNQKKRALLDAEGVIFDNEGILVTKNAWYCFKKKA